MQSIGIKFLLTQITETAWKKKKNYGGSSQLSIGPYKEATPSKTSCIPGDEILIAWSLGRNMNILIFLINHSVFVGMLSLNMITSSSLSWL